MSRHHGPGGGGRSPYTLYTRRMLPLDRYGLEIALHKGPHLKFSALTRLIEGWG